MESARADAARVAGELAKEYPASYTAQMGHHAERWRCAKN
jgi:hypothetical protein